MKESSININPSVNTDGSHFNKNFNPFTAPDCNIFGLKDAWMACIQYFFFFQFYNTSTFNVMCFDENPPTCQSEKGDKKG